MDENDLIPQLRELLAKEPGWEYGDVLPLRGKDGKLEFALPGMARDTLEGLVDLLEGTRTGEVSGRGLMALTGLGAGAGMKVPENALGVFAGKMARKAPLEDMFAAEDLLEGAPESTADKVWNVMGVGNRFADKATRWEIPDNTAILAGDANLPDFWQTNKGKKYLPDLLNHPELYKNYPQLRDVEVRALPFATASSLGAADSENKILWLNKHLYQSEPENARGTVLHEVQHLVDAIEGFPSGGAPQNYLPKGHNEDLARLYQFSSETGDSAQKAAEAVAKKYGARLNNFTLKYEIPTKGLDALVYDQDFARLSQDKKIQFLEDLERNPVVAPYLEAQRHIANMEEAGRLAHKKYQALAGETGARLTENRANATPEGRKISPPWKMMDVPLEEQVVTPPNRFGANVKLTPVTGNPFEAKSLSTKERNLPRDNFLDDLSVHTPILHRESSPSNALPFLPTSRIQAEIDEPYFADVPHLALGQGENKGITLSFSSKGLQGKINTAKPTWEHLYKQGEAEYIGKHNTQKQYQNNLTGIKVAKDVKMTPVEKAQYARALADLEQQGWNKTETDTHFEYRKPRNLP